MVFADSSSASGCRHTHTHIHIVFNQLSFLVLHHVELGCY